MAKLPTRMLKINDVEHLVFPLSDPTSTSPNGSALGVTLEDFQRAIESGEAIPLISEGRGPEGMVVARMRVDIEILKEPESIRQ